MSDPIPTRHESTRQVVLIVDDEAIVRRLVRSILDVHGYAVLDAADGLEAIEVYLERGREIDLVVLDMAMPRMDGAATFEALRTIDPEAAVLISTGLPERGLVEDLLACGARGLLPKPYRAAALVEAVRRAIERYPAVGASGRGEAMSAT